MTHKLKGILVTMAAIAVLAVGGGAIAGATGGDHSEKSITGDALVKAEKVALAHTGGGRVTDTEVGDEEGYYEIEVVRGDGSQVDVHLDRNFSVLHTSADGAGDKPGPNDD